jgi:hypothetical protein
MPTLRDASASIEQSLNDVLGDEITYTPADGAPATFNAWVEFGDVRLSSPGSSASADTIVIEVPFAKVAQPTKDDRIAITIRPGMLYAPAAIEQGETGQTWRIPLRKVAS